MDKAIIIGILCVGLLLSGCAEQAAEVDVVDTDDTTEETVDDTVDEVSNDSESTTDLDITQEDLDKLGQDLENIEADDLGGLTE